MVHPGAVLTVHHGFGHSMERHEHHVLRDCCLKKRVASSTISQHSAHGIPTCRSWSENKVWTAKRQAEERVDE